jgi:hypothetical protein
MITWSTCLRYRVMKDADVDLGDLSEGTARLIIAPDV